MRGRDLFNFKFKRVVLNLVRELVVNFRAESIFGSVSKGFLILRRVRLIIGEGFLNVICKSR